MIYQVLIYNTIPDYEEKRKPFRSLHFDHVKKYAERGEIIMGGGLGTPTDQALIVFKGDSPLVAENFAKTDPYVINGMVLNWEVKPWNELASGLIVEKD